jgi:hypothetical protein
MGKINIANKNELSALYLTQEAFLPSSESFRYDLNTETYKVLPVDPEVFKAPFYALLDKLEQWPASNSIDISIKASIDWIRHNFFLSAFSGSQSTEYFKTIQLRLEQIYCFLNNNQISLFLRKKKYLLLEVAFANCAPGVFTHIEDIFYSIQNEVSLEKILAQCRRELIQEITDEYMVLHSLNTGYGIHVFNAFLSYAKNNDWNPESLSYLSNEVIDLNLLVTDESLINFQECFLKRYTPEHIVEYTLLFILEKLAVFCNREDIRSENGWMIFSNQYTEFLSQFLSELGFEKVNADRYLELNDEMTMQRLSIEQLRNELIHFLCAKGLFQKHIVIEDTLYFLQDFFPLEWIKNAKLPDTLLVKDSLSQQMQVNWSKLSVQEKSIFYQLIVDSSVAQAEFLTFFELDSLKEKLPTLNFAVIDTKVTSGNELIQNIVKYKSELTEERLGEKVIIYKRQKYLANFFLFNSPEVFAETAKTKVFDILLIFCNLTQDLNKIIREINFFDEHFNKFIVFDKRNLTNHHDKKKKIASLFKETSFDSLFLDWNNEQELDELLIASLNCIPFKVNHKLAPYQKAVLLYSKGLFASKIWEEQKYSLFSYSKAHPLLKEMRELLQKVSLNAELDIPHYFSTYLTLLQKMKDCIPYNKALKAKLESIYKDVVTEQISIILKNKFNPSSFFSTNDLECNQTIKPRGIVRLSNM